MGCSAEADAPGAYPRRPAGREALAAVIRRGSEALVEAMFTASAQPIALTRFDSGDIVEVSPACCELFGMSRDELVGSTVESAGLALPPAERARLVEEVRARGGVGGIELPLRRRSGEVRYCRLSVQLVTLDGVDHLLSIVADVTARVFAERALADVEERFRVLVEQMPAAAYMDALDGTPLYTSPHIRAMLGFDPDEWSARWPADVHPDDRERVLATYERHLVEHVPYEEDYRMMTADGRVLHVHDRSTIVRDAAGVPRFSLGFLVDVTARRAAEEALRESEARRSEVLTEMLRAEERTLARVATELHDDSIQAITAALMSIDRALAGDDPAAHAAGLRTARASLAEALDRMRRMTFELRPPVLERRGLGPAVRELASGAAREAGFALTVDVDVGRYPFATEELAYRTIEEAIWNVRKHAEAASVHVALRERDGRLEGEVRDDGRGFRVERALDRSGGRPSLGIDAMLERIRLAGGQAVVRSAPGEGATIAFRVPLAPRGLPAPPAGQPGGSDGEEDPMSESGGDEQTIGDAAAAPPGRRAGDEQRPGEGGDTGEDIWERTPGQDGPPEGDGS